MQVDEASAAGKLSNWSSYMTTRWWGLSLDSVAARDGAGGGEGGWVGGVREKG